MQDDKKDYGERRDVEKEKATNKRIIKKNSCETQ